VQIAFGEDVDAERMQVAALKGRSSTEDEHTPRHPALRPGVSSFFRAAAARYGGPPGRPRGGGCTNKALSHQHSAVSQPGAKIHMFSGDAFVKMYYFAIEI
jgi:hypothetical protein